nr:TIGR03985 family CRISPR-associated protein [Okeania sp. SIO2C9]
MVHQFEKRCKLWEKGKLPTIEYVEQELEKAWGFNLYLPRDLLIMRFESKFARWYVDDTVRHPTFQPIISNPVASV